MQLVKGNEQDSAPIGHNGSGAPPSVTTDAVTPAVSLRGVEKRYARGAESVRVIERLDLDIPAASFTAIMGPSGSGKSTLLNIIAGLDSASTGTVTVFGSRLDQMEEAQLARWRASTVGFVFQTYNLFPVLTSVENVAMALVATSLTAKERRERAQTALRIVGLSERNDHYPNQLSGGQQQRVAIARAIVHDPRLIVADEPTGDLDRKSADEILHLLEALNGELKKTIVMVTHDPAAAERAHKTLNLAKGHLL